MIYILVAVVLFAFGMLVTAIVASLFRICVYLIAFAGYLVIFVLAGLGLLAQWFAKHVSTLLRRYRGLPESEAEPGITIRINYPDEEDDIDRTVELPRSHWRRLRG
jgi:hypothetical protein